MSMYEIMKELHENEVTKERASVLVFEVISRIMIDYQKLKLSVDSFGVDEYPSNEVFDELFYKIQELINCLHTMILLVDFYKDLVLVLQGVQSLLASYQGFAVAGVYLVKMNGLNGIEKDTYLMKNTETGLLKIGKSSNIKARIDSIECGAGAKIKLLYVIDGDVEKLLHDMFSQYKKHREWFDDRDGKIVAYFKEASKQGVKQ